MSCKFTSAPLLAKYTSDVIRPQVCDFSDEAGAGVDSIVFPDFQMCCAYVTREDTWEFFTKTKNQSPRTPFIISSKPKPA